MSGGERDSNPPIKGNALAQELLREGHPVCLIARGWSMWPVLRDGDRVEIVPVRPGDLQPGEIGACVENSPFPESGGLILHRLLRWEAGGRTGIFRGDACPALDPPVPADRIVGRVSAGWRQERRIPERGFRGRWAVLLQPVWRRLFAGAAAGLRFYRGGPSLSPGSGVQAARERVLLAFAQGTSPEGGRLLPFSSADEMISTVLEDPAYQHLLPLVARECRTHPICGLSPDLRKRLQDEEDRALFHSAQTEGLLGHLAALLRQAGQELLVVKGTALAFTGVYAEPHLRQGADVDTLCLPGQERLLADLLLQNGFENAEPEYPVEYYLRYRSEVALFRRSALRWPTLEVHWTAGGSLFYGRRLKAERLWQDSRPGPWGEGLRVLSPEMELVHSLAHLTKHLRVLRPVWALDVALLVRRGLDWDRVEREIRAARLEWPAWIGFEWVESRIPGTIPPDLIRRMRTARARGLGAWPEMRILHAVRSRQTRWIEALCLPTWGQRLGYLREQAWPSRFVMERLYPEAQGRSLAFFRVRRWMRILGEGWRKAGRSPTDE